MATFLNQPGFPLIDVEILEESAPYAKGQARVSSFTIAGARAGASSAAAQAINGIASN